MTSRPKEEGVKIMFFALNKYTVTKRSKNIKNCVTSFMDDLLDMKLVCECVKSLN